MLELLEKEDLLLFWNKLIQKIPDSRNTKKHYQSFLRKKNTKSVKQSEIISYQPNTYSNIVDIKSVITEHSKTSRKLAKSIRQAEKVGSNCSLCSDTQKAKKKTFKWRNCKNNKTRTCF